MGKLKHYGIRGMDYSWFESYLKARKRHISINGFYSKVLPISHGVPDGSVLGPLLFLLYIKALHTAIKFCKVHHFADDTNLPHKVTLLRNWINLSILTWKVWINKKEFTQRRRQQQL